MKASAFATLTIAYSRAFSARVRSCAFDAVSVIWRQMAPPELEAGSAQKRAISVCSGVRVVELMLPRDFTCSKASVYLSLVRAGGGGARNCEPLSSANGVTPGHHVVTGMGLLAGGVGCQSPGSEPIS